MFFVCLLIFTPEEILQRQDRVVKIEHSFLNFVVMKLAKNNYLLAELLIFRQVMVAWSWCRLFVLHINFILIYVNFVCVCVCVCV